MRPFNPNYIVEVIYDLLPFLPVTLFMVFSSVICGSLLGLILAKAKINGGKISRFFANTYIAALRCTPPIVLLFIIFYTLPELIFKVFHIDINGMYKGVFVIIAFSLLFAASMAEIMRTAYSSIDKGQFEAAVSIGLSPFQAFYRIVLPQAVVVALPNFCNSLVSLMKDGSLAFTIGLIDLLGKGNLIIAKNFGAYSLEIYIALALIYWVLTIITEKLFGVLETFLSKGRKKIRC